MSVLGIDIGSTHCVVATVGKGTVFVIRNELSERLTPALVGYTDDRRLIGDLAASQLMSNYKNTCRNMKNLLGRFMNDPNLEYESYYSLCEFGEAENGLIGYKVRYKGEERVFSATRVLAALLVKLKDIAEKSLEKKILEVVVACPGWFTDIHRSAMLAATEIAGLKCLRIFSEHVATALDYGIYRLNHFSDATPVRVAFVSMGHCNTSVSIVEFTKEKLQVLAEAGDRTLGGRNMDNLLVEYFVTDMVKSGLNPLANAKARLKLEEQAGKIRKVLSANSEAVCSIECLYEDHDLYSLVTRDTFTGLCAQSLVPQLQAVMARAMRMCDLSVEEIHSVEAVGGCTRIPWVRDEISTFFGKEISRTLSADECIARGCALQAAMCSVHFKVREFGCHERLVHPIAINWSSVDGTAKGIPETPHAATSQMVILMPLGMNTNQRKKLRVKRSGPFVINAFYASPGDLPEGTPVSLGSCLINLPETNPAAPVEVMVHVTLNFHGQFKFLSAYVKEMVEESSKAETTKTTDSLQNGDAGAEEVADKSGSKAEANGSNEAEKGKESTFRKLEVAIVVNDYPGKYVAGQTSELCDVELEMAYDDKLQLERLDVLNEVESTIFSTRENLHGDFEHFSTDVEKKVIYERLEAMEDWLYDNSDAEKSVLQAQLEEIRDLCRPIMNRLSIAQELASSEDMLKKLMEQCISCAAPHNERYAHVPDEKRIELNNAVAMASDFLSKMSPLNPLRPDENQLSSLKKGTTALKELYDNFLSTPVPVPKPAETSTLPAAPQGTADVEVANGNGEQSSNGTVEEPMGVEGSEASI